MIRFTNVRGDVLVDDRKKDDRVMAYDGLTLDAAGDYLIATTQSSSADVQTQGKVARLGPFSFLRLGVARRLEGKHGEYWTAKTTKVFLARVWAAAGGR
jgi:hypothetical protein